MKRRIRLGIKEIKERKVFLSQQEERRNHFEELTEGLSARAKAMVFEDQERPFSTKAFVMDVLELIRLFAEGHNTLMQDYMRVQKNQVTTHDLVTEIYLFLLALEPELDDTNVEQAHKAVETLTELCQGNASQGNANLLLQTKLVSILERIVEKTTLGGSGAEVELQRLRVSSLTLLEALLEGSNSAALSRMLRVIDLKSLASSTTKCYKDALALPASSDSRPLLIDASYSLYLLLLHLKGYQEQGEGLLPGQIKSITALDEETKAELDKTVTSVEIVNSIGELERVYFRHPLFCLLPSHSSRERILWMVDRETPGKQVQEFLILWAPEMQREMMHLETLQRWPLWKVLSWFKDRGVVEFMFFLAIAQNVILLLRFSSLREHPLVIMLDDVEFVLGVLQLICSVTVFAMHALQSAHRGWRDLLSDTELIFLTVAFIAARYY